MRRPVPLFELDRKVRQALSRSLDKFADLFCKKIVAQIRKRFPKSGLRVFSAGEPPLEVVELGASPVRERVHHQPARSVELDESFIEPPRLAQEEKVIYPVREPSSPNS